MPWRELSVARLWISTGKAFVCFAINLLRWLYAYLRLFAGFRVFDCLGDCIPFGLSVKGFFEGLD